MKKLGFGAMRLPENGRFSKGIDLDLTCEMIDYFIEKGYNYFDTAYPYHSGKSEETLNKCLVERYSREDFILIDKLPTFSLKKEEDMEKYFNIQQERCGVEYFDYYLIHDVAKRNLNAIRKFNPYEYVKKLKKEGKVKHIGFSFHDDAEFLEEMLNEMPEIEVVMLQINYLDWESSAVQSRKCYEICRKYNKEIMVMEPLKGGTLVNVPDKAKDILKTSKPEMSVPSWALRFVAGLKDVSIVFSGMHSIEDVKENIETMDNFEPLDEKEHKILQDVAGIIKGVNIIPCTYCNYCAENCEDNIPISKFFELYNADLRENHSKFSKYLDEYNEYASIAAYASDCTFCGNCVDSCPQQLDIPDYMEDVADYFE